MTRKPLLPLSPNWKEAGTDDSLPDLGIDEIHDRQLDSINQIPLYIPDKITKTPNKSYKLLNQKRQTKLTQFTALQSSKSELLSSQIKNKAIEPLIERDNRIDPIAAVNLSNNVFGVQQQRMKIQVTIRDDQYNIVLRNP